jgi:hypothetical protein
MRSRPLAVSLRGIRAASGKTRQVFAKELKIPLGKYLDWEAGLEEPPKYIQVRLNLK